MKKSIVILCLALVVFNFRFTNGHAQIISNSATLTIECRKNYDIAVLQLQLIVDSTNSIITYRNEKMVNEGKRQITLNISSDRAGYSAVLKKLMYLGKIINSNVVTSEKSIDTLNVVSNLNINYEKKDKIQKILDTMKITNREYNNFLNQETQVEIQINALIKQLREMKDQFKRPNSFSVNIFEFIETNYVNSSGSYRTNSMLGGGYCLYDINNFRKDISNKSFQGPFIRYSSSLYRMHLEIGLLKGSEFSDTANTTSINKLLNIQFGQIFYPRYFGRGNLRYFNVFAGYDVGLVFANSKERMNTFFQLAPNLGCEIFKCKYFFIDLKGGYKVSFYKFQFLSGPFLNGSFDFVF